MNTFDDFKLIGANASRFVPILGNASGIVGAYRKAMGVKVRAREKFAGKIELGMVPLFLLDGRPSENSLPKTAAKLGLTVYAVICRPFNVEIKKNSVSCTRYAVKEGVSKTMEANQSGYRTPFHDMKTAMISRENPLNLS